MARGIRKERKARPTFYVFCEGKSEKEYVNYLKMKYRIPIEIKSQVTGHSISQRTVDSHIDIRTRHEKDKTFLMYDLDEEGLLTKLHERSDGTLIVSNPCIELWFLLHYRNQRANVS